MEERLEKNLNRIEKLIVDGQKELWDKAEGRFNQLENRLGRLEEGQREIIKKVDRIDKKHDLNTLALHEMLKDHIGA